MANGLFGGGNGEELTPYLVEDAEDLDAVRNDLAAHYKQTANIDLSGYANWVPIESTWNNGFSGLYDGNNFTISNLTQDLVGTTYEFEWGMTGLFGYCEDATLKNIKL